jgi:hypothetical protein
LKLLVLEEVFLIMTGIRFTRTSIANMLVRVFGGSLVD